MELDEEEPVVSVLGKREMGLVRRILCVESLVWWGGGSPRPFSWGPAQWSETRSRRRSRVRSHGASFGRVWWSLTKGITYER